MVDKSVTEHGLRKRQTGAHQHGGPDNAMEAGNVLADDMQVGGPVLAEQGLVVPAKAERRNIIDERVEPHIHHMPRIVRQRDTPVEAGARYAYII